jgi:hypothetical protein
MSCTYLHYVKRSHERERNCTEESCEREGRGIGPKLTSLPRSRRLSRELQCCCRNNRIDIRVRQASREGEKREGWKKVSPENFPHLFLFRNSGKRTAPSSFSFRQRLYISLSPSSLYHLLTSRPKLPFSKRNTSPTLNQ